MLTKRIMIIRLYLSLAYCIIELFQIKHLLKLLPELSLWSYCRISKIYPTIKGETKEKFVKDMAASSSIVNEVHFLDTEINFKDCDETEFFICHEHDVEIPTQC